MEVNDNNLNALANFLSSTLSPDYSVRRPAEQHLENVEKNEGKKCFNFCRTFYRVVRTLFSC